MPKQKRDKKTGQFAGSIGIGKHPKMGHLEKTKIAAQKAMAHRVQELRAAEFNRSVSKTQAIVTAEYPDATHLTVVDQHHDTRQPTDTDSALILPKEILNAEGDTLWTLEHENHNFGYRLWQTTAGLKHNLKKLLPVIGHPDQYQLPLKKNL